MDKLIAYWKNTFSDSDKEKVIEFLNMIAGKAEFNMNTSEVIKYFQLLSYMQNELLPKISDNVFEIVSVKPAKGKK